MIPSNIKLRVKYEYTTRFGSKTHTWSVVGAAGAIHLHISDYGVENGASGGLEIHRRSPPEYGKHDAPDHDDCRFVGGPCWHDGSSLVVEEVWKPLWKDDPNDHDNMFERLRYEYCKHFVEEGEQ